jgi:hypothetical protein
MNDQDEVRHILTDFEQRIRAILDRAWTEWLEMPKKGKLSARSRASVVFDFVLDDRRPDLDHARGRPGGGRVDRAGRADR